MNCNSRRQKLRAVFAGETCIHPGSVYDPISARVAEDLGFEAGMFAGSVASLTVLGAPDLIVLTLSEFADQAHRICRACLTIEDTLLPKRFGEAGTEFLSIAEAVGKMKGAVDARQDAEMIVLGRTGAVGPNGVDDGIRRAAAYLDAGVDGIMFVGVRTRAELESIARVIEAPIMLGGSGPELKDPAYLSSCGVRVSLQGHQPFMAAVQAMHDCLKALREGTPPAQLQGVASTELMEQLSRDASYREWKDEYLG